MEVFEELYRNGVNITDEQIAETYAALDDSERKYASTSYDVRLLKLIGREVLQGSTNISSMIARCIERNLEKSLLYLLSLELPVQPLHLRWFANAKLLTVAASHGWIDHEFEKRIVLIQRMWRRQPLSVLKYEGPDLQTYVEEKKYFGHRQAWYTIRWDRKHLHRFYSCLLKNERWGDCAWQTYVDKVENEDDTYLPHDPEWVGYQ